MNNSTSGHSTEPDVTFLQNLRRYAYGYIMFTTCLVGIFSNILAFAVLSRKSMRSSNTAVYLRCLAAVDSCVLLLAIFRYQSYFILLPEKDIITSIFQLNPYVQVYLTPFFWIFLGMSSFTTFSLSLERYLAVRWPLTLKQTCTMTTVACCLGGITLTVFLITFPQFLCYKIEKAVFRNTHIVVAKLTNDYLDAHAYMQAYDHYILPIFWYMVPWFAVATFNTLLSIEVHKSSRIRIGIPNIANPNRKLSVLIMLIVFVYMICHFPRCILAFYCLINNCSSTTEGEGVDFKTYHIVQAVADMLNVLNSCCNFVIYCMSGTRFRKEAKQLLCQFCCNSQPLMLPTMQSVHISLQGVPATPVDVRKSFNMSYKELQITPNLSPSKSMVELQIPDSCARPSSSSSCKTSPSTSCLKLPVTYQNLTI